MHNIIPEGGFEPRIGGRGARCGGGGLVALFALLAGILACGLSPVLAQTPFDDTTRSVAGDNTTKRTATLDDTTRSVAGDNTIKRAITPPATGTITDKTRSGSHTSPTASMERAIVADYLLLEDFVRRSRAYSADSFRHAVYTSVDALRAWLHASSTSQDSPHRQRVTKVISRAERLLSSMGGRVQPRGEAVNSSSAAVARRQFALHVYTARSREEALALWREDRKIVAGVLGNNLKTQLRLSDEGLIRVYIGDYPGLEEAAAECGKLQAEGVWCRPVGAGISP